MNEPTYCKHCGRRLKLKPAESDTRLARLCQILKDMPDHEFDSFIEIAETIRTMHPRGARPVRGEITEIETGTRMAWDGHSFRYHGHDPTTPRKIDTVPF